MRAERLVAGLTGSIAGQACRSPMLARELDWQTAHEHRHFPPIPRCVEKRDERVLVTYGTTLVTWAPWAPWAPYEPGGALPAKGLRAIGSWLGDRIPDPLGSWLLRLCDDSEEPWTDAEGRIYR